MVVSRTASNKAIFSRRASSSFAGQLLLAISILSTGLIVTSRTRIPQQSPSIIAPVVKEFDSVAILVPSEPVPAGTKLKDIKLKKISYPRHQIPTNSLQEIDEFGDFVAITSLPANLPLFRENLSQIGHISNPVQEKIPLGMRAMTIRVDATSAVEGWAGSGSVVDILLIEKDRTTVVAERVQILSAERSVAPIEGQAIPTVPSTVTLLVTQEQCLSVNTAIPMGKIAFALRSARDEESWLDTEFKSSELMTKLKQESLEIGSVRGVLSIKGEEDQKSFALTNGRWVKTEVLPQGFFVNRGGSE